MSKGSIARATIVGRMGSSIHVKTIGSGDTRVGELSLAVTHGYGDKQSTSWFTVKVWNKKKIEILQDYSEKGSRLFVEGELKIRQYEKDGSKRYATEIEVGFDGSIEILDGIKSDENRAGTRASSREEPSRANDYGRRPAPAFDDDLDDDVPF